MENRRSVERSYERSQRLFDLLTQVACQSFHLDPHPEAALFRLICEPLRLDFYLHYPWQPESHRLWLGSHAGLPEPALAAFESLPVAESILGAAGLEQTPKVAENVPASTDPQLNLFRAIQVQAAACFPLLADGELLGLLAFGTRQRSSFAPDEVAIMQASAVQLTSLLHRRRTEEALCDLTQQLDLRVRERTAQLLETSEQMEAFCYSISHDLRAPLRTIRGFSQALVEDYAEVLDDNGKDYLHRVMAGAEKMDTLIHDLLEYSRLGRSTLTFESVSLEASIDRILQQFADDIVMKQATVAIERPIPQVHGHGPTIDQMLTNLVSNALKFVPAGVAPRIRIWAAEQGDSVRLSVEDNGIGIAPENQHKIFGVFERLHGVDIYPGTGIGLAIVAKGVARMGGRTGVESALGQGSRFWIELPRANAESGRVAA